jgi:hypothetical protein
MTTFRLVQGKRGDLAALGRTAPVIKPPCNSRGPRTLWRSNRPLPKHGEGGQLPRGDRHGALRALALNTANVGQHHHNSIANPLADVPTDGLFSEHILRAFEAYRGRGAEAFPERGFKADLKAIARNLETACRIAVEGYGVRSVTQALIPLDWLAAAAEFQWYRSAPGVLDPRIAITKDFRAEGGPYPYLGALWDAWGLGYDNQASLSKHSNENSGSRLAATGHEPSAPARQTRTASRLRRQAASGDGPLDAAERPGASGDLACAGARHRGDVPG